MLRGDAARRVSPHWICVPDRSFGILQSFTTRPATNLAVAGFNSLGDFLLEMNNFSKLLASAALSAALVLAQPPGEHGRPGGPPPDPQTRIQNRVNFLATLLSLTDDQKAQATTIFTNAYTAAQSASSSVQTARQSLSDAVKKNDTATIDQVSATIGSAEGQITAINAKADAAFYAILTPDQKTKYDAMPHGGPGGMGPMGQRFGNAGAARYRPPQ